MSSQTDETVGIRLRGDLVELEFGDFMKVLKRLGEYRKAIDAARALDDTIHRFGLSQETWAAHATLHRTLRPIFTDLYEVRE